MWITLILIVDVVEQQKPANQVLVVAPLICVKYALKVPARSTRTIQSGGEVVKLYFETGPMLY